MLRDALRGRVLVVCWSWYLSEKIAVGLAGLVRRRVIVVVHNPGGRGARSRANKWAERFEQSLARKLVAHSDLLARPLPGEKAYVCVHPTYRAYVRGQDPPPRRELRHPITLIVLGAVRPDKGLDLLSDIFGRVAPDIRDRLRLHLIGRDPSRGATTVQALQGLVPVVNEMVESGVTDARLISALSEADALLAFYPGATQSGSAILAMTVGRPVLAFDSGALPEIIRPEFLVPSGDVAAAATLIESFADGQLPRSSNLTPLHGWEERAMSQWDGVVQAVAGVPR